MVPAIPPKPAAHVAPRPFASPRPPARRPAVARAGALQRRVPPLWLLLLPGAVALAAVAYLLLDVASRRAPELQPRHRAEALCFLLARPPAFDPPMPVQPSAALVRGRFNAGAPASFAVQELMGFGDERILRQWSERVGDYDVAAFWLRLPGPENVHWLVLGWMEDADLAVCNFRFTGSSRVLSADEKAWGMRILQRLLVPDNFRRGVLPAARLRAAGGQTMPTFGPRSQ